MMLGHIPRWIERGESSPGELKADGHMGTPTKLFEAMLIETLSFSDSKSAVMLR
jgi:hypothetical protein